LEYDGILEYEPFKIRDCQPVVPMVKPLLGAGKRTVDVLPVGHEPKVLAEGDARQRVEREIA